ncbi:MAG: hypothetical protein K0S81_632 [Rhodospirillales bacterium]|jgi:uncharacterized membrane protein YbaN (DUF454 family)|nr:hypothetical protein [Rhodospirillales bacterium]
MTAQLRRIAILILGWIFILLGIAGLFLPFLQGFLFLFIGVLLLSRESEIVRRQLERTRERYPKFGRYMDEAEAWMKKQWNRLRGYPR